MPHILGFFASRKYLFPASVLNVLLRLLFFLLFYPANSGTQIYRDVNDTEVTTLMLNVPTHYKATPLCFRSGTATCHDVREIIFYICNISAGFHDSLLLYLFIATKWRRSWTGICHVSLGSSLGIGLPRDFGSFLLFLYLWNGTEDDACLLCTHYRLPQSRIDCYVSIMLIT